jgi:hypothetical protein
MVSLNFGDINLFRIVHQRLSDAADQVFYGSASFAGGIEINVTK